ncbi:diacylglycerol/lipid kinase family protein [Flavobacterium plurextorum]|uniref:Diacylglycerol kinase family lipid kinase n=2 Tax=Flavobacterium TaxID=237 RepID=A0A9X1HAQ3_9FLAO|nr:MULTISPECIES: diacylglycerol kinase family protein [Flavobacterium]MBW1658627.1 diacylglycerol kinase family lipid kinase [Flavobacterium quisquiliarum]MBZ4035250.1 diacylglycerol kinase family lipid kinase [Flavobacterium potami]WET02519.1 diacylglycerol kinase family protein [Flavobacterium sp. YJ01]
MTYIHFIINPVSGDGRHSLSDLYIRQFFPADRFKIRADYTLRKKHALSLTASALEQNPDIIVACGGDGTINEVASCLIGTGVELGIIPLGSGNGLASHLNIPHDIEKSLEVIRDRRKIRIDAGRINQHYFFSNAGVGIDAMVIKKYEHSAGRMLFSYIRAAVASSFEYKAQPTVVYFDDRVIPIRPFMVFVSNSNEMGYSMSLTPDAMLTDGRLNLVLIPELSFIEKIALGYHILNRSVSRFKKAQHHLVQNLCVEMPNRIFTDAQIDGEHYKLRTNSCRISVAPAVLTVLV